MNNILSTLQRISENPIKTYPNQGYEYVMCYKRKKLIRATNEELVRQAFIRYILDEEGISPTLIEVEWQVKKVNSKASLDRIDIVLFKDDTSDYAEIVVELKATNVAITERTLNQAKRYTSEIGAKYIILYNGHTLEAYAVDGDTSEKIEFQTIKELLKSNYDVIDQPWKWRKSTEKELQNEEYLKLYLEKVWLGLTDQDRYILSNDTPMDKLPYIIRLLDFIFDNNSNFLAVQPDTSSVILDQKFLPWTYTAFGGHSFDEYYRSVVLEDKKTGDVFSAKFAIYSYDMFVREKEEVFNSSHRGTYIMVGIDFGEYSSHSLELKFDKYGEITDDGSMEIFHDGAITIRTRRKNQLTIDFVKDPPPNLIKHGRIYLGKLPKHGPYKPDDKDVCALLANIIDYAYLRYKMRMVYG